MRTIYSESDDLIYNRLDLIYGENICKTEILEDDKIYRFQFYIDGDIAEINVWRKNIPSIIFGELLQKLFDENKTIMRINVRSSINNYDKQLVGHGDVMLRLPTEHDEDLLNRLGSKGRHTLRRKKRILEERFEKLRIENDSTIKLGDVEKYFKWKKASHGTDYHLSESEYLKKFHVTNAIKLIGDNELISILFYCKSGSTVYLENFSYNPEYKKYSPGLMLYLCFLEQMTKEGIRYVFLGKSGLDYKKRFGSEEIKCYSGVIYRESVFDTINMYLARNNIAKVAIYGLGKVGKDFLAIIHKLNCTLLYGIDREKREVEGLVVLSPEQIINADEVDITIICMEKENPEVEDNLKQIGRTFLYSNELIEIGIKNAKCGGEAK